MPSQVVIVTVPDRDRPDRPERPERPDRPPPSSSTILSPADLTFVGYYRWAYHWDLWFSYGQLALRHVNGELRMFTNGNQNDNYPLTEYAVPPGAEPHPDITQAPLLTVVKDWGTFIASNTPPSPHLPNGGSSPSILVGSWWDQARNGIWYTYGDSYVPVMDHTTLFFYHLNDATGVGTYYGPWRLDGPINHVRGSLMPVPLTLRPTGGHEIGVMAGQSSGNATSPFGCNLHTFTLPDPFTHPPDSNANEIPSITKRTVLMHDLDHRQARSSNYKNCSWNGGQYQCQTHGSSTMPGVPLWGGPDPESCGDDTIATAVCIDTPTKQGMLYFGTLCEAPPGYVPPGSDPDGQIHQWYGASEHGTSPNGQLKCCCHDQDDPYWNATGPGTHYRRLKGWIYDPADLIAVAEGTVDPWRCVPAHEFGFEAIWPVAATRVRPGLVGPAHFDPETGRIYVSSFGQDRFEPRERWAVAVFQVAG